MLNQKYRYVAIDESGDIGNTKKSSRYFVLVAFMHNEENINRKIRKFIAKLNHNKSGKKISMLHARNDTDKIKLKLVKFLDTFDWQANCIVVDKNKNEVDYFEYLDSLVKNMDHVESILISTPTNNKSFQKKVLIKSEKIKIDTPVNEPTIQLSDIIAWTIYKKYEDDEDIYFNQLESKINFIKN